jgi:predicted transcriptional regulator
MRKPAPHKPTNAELDILRVLWQRGPSTVREVHAGLERGAAVGYTTILKLLQIMAEKGLVSRDESARSHVYTARVGERATQQRLVSDLLERAFGGSALGLVMQALSTKRPSRAELDELRRLLDDLNGGAP